VDPQSLDMSLLIGQTRSHVIQIRLPPEVEIHDAWPWSRYDDEDELFFVSEDSSWDSCNMRLSGFFILEIGRREVKVEFECMFYALGWSMLEAGRMQCTLVDYRAHATELTELQSQLPGWAHTSAQVLDLLDYHNIPKASAAVFKVPRTKARAFVSFKPTLLDDPRICRNKFWRIEISCAVYEDGNLPQISRGRWSKAAPDT